MAPQKTAPRCWRTLRRCLSACVLASLLGATAATETHLHGTAWDRSIAATLDADKERVLEEVFEAPGGGGYLNYKGLVDLSFGHRLYWVSQIEHDDGVSLDIELVDGNSLSWKIKEDDTYEDSAVIATLNSVSSGLYEGIDVEGTLILFSFRGISAYSERVIVEVAFKIPPGYKTEEEKELASKYFMSELEECLYGLQQRFSTYPCPSTSDYRTHNGHCNNVRHPLWGSTGAPMLRMPFNDPDDIWLVESNLNELRPSAREVSNRLMHQEDDDMPNEASLNMLWVSFGQFIDHDLTLNLVHGSDSPLFKTLNIPVAKGDRLFEQFASEGSGCSDCAENYIAFAGSQRDRDLHGFKYPFNQFNDHTSFLDLSQLYGNDKSRGIHLRSRTGGKLWTSRGNLMPLNKGNKIKIGLSNDPAISDDFFAAGDIRANEQPWLTTLHHIWLREHNRVAEELESLFPYWDDDTLYEEARKIVVAEYQMIVYNEWLPLLLGFGALGNYTGYNNCVDPTSSAFFSTVAFRFGHTMVSGKLCLANKRLENLRSVKISETFFNEDFWDEEDVSVNRLFFGAVTKEAQKVDASIHNELRNALFNKVDDGKAPGFDLAAANINRGRDHGIPSYTDARKNFGLPVPDTWVTRGLGCGDYGSCGLDQLLEEPDDVQKLIRLYGRDGLNNMDAFPLCLMEKIQRDKGAIVGETLHAAIKDQFTRLRDGDRFYYENVDFPCELDGYEHLQNILMGKVNMKTIFLRNMNGAREPERVAELNKTLPENVFLTPPADGRRQCTPPLPILTPSSHPGLDCQGSVPRVKRYFWLPGRPSRYWYNRQGSVRAAYICDLPGPLVDNRKGFKTYSEAWRTCGWGRRQRWPITRNDNDLFGGRDGREESEVFEFDEGRAEVLEEVEELDPLPAVAKKGGAAVVGRPRDTPTYDF